MGAASKGAGPKLDWFIREIASVDLDPNYVKPFLHCVMLNSKDTYIKGPGEVIERNEPETISLHDMSSG